MGAIAQMRHMHWFLHYTEESRHYLFLQVSALEPEFMGVGNTLQNALANALAARETLLWAWTQVGVWSLLRGWV